MIMKSILMPKTQNFRKQDELYTIVQLFITVAPYKSQFITFHRVDDNLNREAWLAAIVLLQIGKCIDEEDLDF